MEVPYLAWIPLLPLLSAAAIRFLGRRSGRSAVHFLACGSVLGSLILGLAGFRDLLGHPEEPLTHTLYPWIRVGTFQVSLRFLLDSLSSVMVLVVSGVGFVIHVYSTGYMGREKEYGRYFSYLNLFTAMMLILVLADSLLLMFVGWEGVGLCSYLLIGFWFGEKANADAGRKAFLVNRIGDFGFLLGILVLFWTLGLGVGVWSVDFSALKEHVGLFTGSSLFGVSAATLATLLLFVGAVGKSAQIPLYVWLPDAMAGPTPVSALIHAATMVTAGVYMIARMSFLYDAAPVTLGIVATVGAATAIFAATIGLVQNDIKRVLAYSTVSQLGYMILACGVGAYAAGIFHLVTHSFFKALLFLGAGSVIHSLHHEQDMRKMGGLKSRLPWTYGTFLVATLAISGIPPFAGFFSKDLILWNAWAGPHGSTLLWGVGLLTAALTAFYMFRLLYMTFHGQCRADEQAQAHLNESPATMLIPLVILAILSIFGGMLWWPDFLPISQAFPRWLESSVVVLHPHGTHSQEILLALSSVAAACCGIGAASWMYLFRPETPERLSRRFSRIYRTLLNKYWVDEMYDATIVRFVQALSAGSAWFDRVIVDGLVNGVAWALRILVFIKGTFDTRVVDGLVNGLAQFTLWAGRRVRRWQTGHLQTYLGAMTGALVLLLLVWILGR